MRNIKIFTVLILLLGLISCNPEGKKGRIEGEWKLESYYGKAAESATVPAQVYLSFHRVILNSSKNLAEVISAVLPAVTPTARALSAGHIPTVLLGRRTTSLRSVTARWK